MLMANETVAKEYCQGEYPFVYRTHDNPDPERVESLLTLLRHQGIQVQKACEEITPKEIQEILEQIQGMPNEMMISRLMLRTMKQARYTTECSGHLGLQRNITVILPLRSEDIRIYRSTVSFVII